MDGNKIQRHAAQNKISHEEWAKKILKISEASKKDTRGESLDKAVMRLSREKSFGFGVYDIWFCILLFGLAFVLRLYFIFFGSDPQNAGVGWYNDSYHHWQIAYLSKEIGFHNGFLRLWDLIGMEYFWGLLQPLVLSIFYFLTGSADIVVSRIFNSLAGSVNIVLLFLITKRHFGIKAGVAAGLLALVNPVGVFTDTSGMQEPLVICMMLLGIFFWPGKPFLTGFFWFLASMGRSEYWLFSLGLIIVLLLREKDSGKKLSLLAFYLIPLFGYMKYLLDKTGNMIYPIYWNFFGNAVGRWQADIPLIPEQAQIRMVFLLILILSILAGGFVFFRKPKGYVFSLLGIGNLIFLSFFVGFTAYLKSYLPRFWVDRIFWVSYMWIGFLFAVMILHMLPKYFKKIGLYMGIFTMLAIMLFSQLLWIPILNNLKESDSTLQSTAKIGREIAVYYKGGSVLIDGGDPVLTYEFYKSGILGRNIRGQRYDPFFYFPTSDPYAEWGKYRKKVFDWIKKEDVRLIVFDDNTERYRKLVEVEPVNFIMLGKVGKYNVYGVIKERE